MEILNVMGPTIRFDSALAGSVWLFKAERGEMISPL
jgi:hypothetical protein